jgi:hypothetical protein
MKCPYCLKEMHPRITSYHIGEFEGTHWGTYNALCPGYGCNKTTIFLVNGPINKDRHNNFTGFERLDYKQMIKPKGTNRPPPPQVPDNIKHVFIEACLVLPDSPKASAALSRRCLQHLLREVAKVKPSTLFNEIQEVIDRGGLPSHIIDNLDAIREIGNFAAHPTKSQNTGEIIEVETGEAEWNLDVLETLFDFYLVQPEISKAKKAALQIKIDEARKKK